MTKQIFANHREVFEALLTGKHVINLFNNKRYEMINDTISEVDTCEPQDVWPLNTLYEIIDNS